MKWYNIIAWPATFIFVIAFAFIYEHVHAADPVFKTYAGTVVGCYDADTCDVTFHLHTDLGFGITSVTDFSDKVRLYGIDAWELRGEEKAKGVVARDWLLAQVRGQTLRVDILQKSGRDARGKYGRWLAVLWLGSVNLNEKLVEFGHAERADY